MNRNIICVCFYISTIVLIQSRQFSNPDDLSIVAQLRNNCGSLIHRLYIVRSYVAVCFEAVQCFGVLFGFLFKLMCYPQFCFIDPDLFGFNRFMTIEQRYTTVPFICRIIACKTVLVGFKGKVVYYVDCLISRFLCVYKQISLMLIN